MQELAPTFSISAKAAHCEVHFKISGFWKLDDMQEFLSGLDKAGFPLVALKRPIHVFGDMDGFVPQTRETGEAIRDQLGRAEAVGLARIAILSASPLVKLQYKRLSAGIDVEYFDDRTAALAWLRRPS